MGSEVELCYGNLPDVLEAEELLGKHGVRRPEHPHGARVAQGGPELGVLLFAKK